MKPPRVRVWTGGPPPAEVFALVDAYRAESVWRLLTGHWSYGLRRAAEEVIRTAGPEVDALRAQHQQMGVPPAKRGADRLPAATRRDPAR